MKKSAFTVLVSTLAFAGLAYAQSPASEIRESTDPARVADVEQRAADLQARQQAARMEMTSGDSGTSDASDSRQRNKQPSARHSGQAESQRGHGTHHGASGSSNK